MEQNKEYIAIKSVITSLEHQLETVEHFNQEIVIMNILFVANCTSPLLTGCWSKEERDRRIF